MTFYQELQLDQVGSKSYILRCFCYYLHKTFRSKQ